MLLVVLSLCGFSGALAIRLLDPLLTSVAADFSASITVVALLASAFALPFGFSQPFLGPMGDAFGKGLVIKIGMAALAICLLASALAPNLGLLFVTRVLGGIAAGGIMPVSMALIGDRFPLAVRQLAMSRYIGATLIGQIVGVSAGGILAEWIGWRGVLGCAAAITALAAAVAFHGLPTEPKRGAAPFRLPEAVGRYRLVLANPRSFVCFGVVFLEGGAIYGITPFIGDLLQARGAGGLREAGYVIGGLGAGGLLYAAFAGAILSIATRPLMMAAGGGIAAFGLASLGLSLAWGAQLASMIVLGFGFFLLHNSVQTEVTELAPTARASAFSLHAFSFFMGQALGPVLYGISLPTFGPVPTHLVGAAILVATGLGASLLLRAGSLGR